MKDPIHLGSVKGLYKYSIAIIQTLINTSNHPYIVEFE